MQEGVRKNSEHERDGSAERNRCGCHQRNRRDSRTIFIWILEEHEHDESNVEEGSDGTRENTEDHQYGRATLIGSREDCEFRHKTTRKRNTRQPEQEEAEEHGNPRGTLSKPRVT